MYTKHKILIYLFLTFFLNTATGYSSQQTSPCDRILNKSKQFECIAAEKAKKIKESLGLNKAKKKIENFDKNKKNFDKKNKTLKDLFENMKEKK